jgi:hypothetical protein
MGPAACGRGIGGKPGPRPPGKAAGAGQPGRLRARRPAVWKIAHRRARRRAGARLSTPDGVKRPAARGVLGASGRFSTGSGGKVTSSPRSKSRPVAFPRRADGTLATATAIDYAAAAIDPRRHRQPPATAIVAIATNAHRSDLHRHDCAGQVQWAHHSAISIFDRQAQRCCRRRCGRRTGAWSSRSERR